MAWGVGTGYTKKKPPPNPWDRYKDNSGAQPTLGPSDTTAGLENDTGYTGPSVQDLINSGQIPWDEGLGLGDIGYTAPNLEDDFDTRLRNNPRGIAGKAALEENIKAAGLFRDAAIQKALWALARGQEGIARSATFRGHDLSSSLAGRGILQGGAQSAGQIRIEEDRGRALAEANRLAQDAQSSAEMGYSDQVRGYNQTYEELMAQIAEELAKYPRYHTDPEKPEPGKPVPGPDQPKTSTGKKPPTVNTMSAAARAARRKYLANRVKAGRM
jgi:hypothetical protein